jgi:hypothetical protein
MLQPAKVAIPETALTGFALQVIVPPAGVVMVSVTGLVPAVVFPAASWMAMTGWVLNEVPLVVVEGLDVKPSLVALAGVMAKLVLAAVASDTEVAVSV